jgi:hypothetical protein
VVLLANPTVWTGIVSLLLLAACFLVIPQARRGLMLPAAIAWVYAAFLIFLSIFYLLRSWYVVPLVGLVALTPGGRAVRRFAVALTATWQIENLFLSKSPPFGGWQPWTWLLVMGIPVALLAADLWRDRFDWRVAVRRSAALLLAGLRAPLAAAGESLARPETAVPGKR